MRVARILVIVFLLSLPLAFGFACDDDDDDDAPAAADDDDNNDDDDNDDSPAPLSFCAVDESEIDAILDRLTLRQKVAQMYYTAVNVFPWFDLPEAAYMVGDVQVGGIHEVVALTLGFWPSWTVQNTNKLQNIALNSDAGIPLFIGIDQEGGIPQMMTGLTGGTDTPGNMGLGATFSPDATRLAYDLMARELHETGINLSLAPVLGVMTDHEEASMYTRCFGENTEWVSQHAAAAVEATQRNLVVATPKHFPGQTAAPGDEHYVRAVSEHSEAEIREIYLPPFVAAIEAGADMIMPTHARYAAWEDEYPVTLSSRMLTELLRDELGFEGVIITDDLNMDAVAGIDWGELPDVLAIQAGADIIIDIFEDFEARDAGKAGDYPSTIAEQIDYVVGAVGDGRLTEARIDQSVRRILNLKMKYCLFENPFRTVEDVPERVHRPEDAELSLALHRQAITLLRDEDALLPLDVDDRVFVITTGPLVTQMYPEATWPQMTIKTLLGPMQDIDPDVTGMIYGGTPVGFVADMLVDAAAASGADLLVIGTYNAYFDEVQQDLVNRLLALGLPTVMVAQAMPYDLMVFPDVGTYVASYSNRGLALQVTAEVLYGLSEPGGRLPVALPGMYEIGWSAALD